jgi:hypothetical protein
MKRTSAVVVRERLRDLGGQPPWVSSSPAMCAAVPRAMASASSGTCQRPTGTRARSARV